MKFCTNFTSIITTVDKKNTRLITRLRCGMWTCAYCAKKNQSIWRARIIDHINNNSHLDWSWFTLTAHSKRRGKKTSLKNLRDAWDRLIKRIKRKYDNGEKIHYCRVYEQHKDSSYHLHCIISIKWLNLKIRTSRDGSKTSHDTWLDKQAKSLKLGYYTHAANFDGKHAGYMAGYVTKYMTKLSDDFKETLGRVRRIQTSQGWSKKEYESDLTWIMKSGYYEDNLLTDMTLGRKVLDITIGEYVTYDNFIDSYVYPIEFSHDYTED